MVLQDILISCNEVVKHAKHVKINDVKLKELVENFDFNVENWLQNNTFGLFNSPYETLVNYMFFHNTIGFSYWNKPRWQTTTADGKNHYNSGALLYIMTEKLKQDPDAFDYKNLMSWTFKDFQQFLTLNVELSLLLDRWKKFDKVRTVINEKFNGSLPDAIKNYNTDEELFNFIISNFNCFKDDAAYNGKTVHFYKLAQLTTGDILYVKKLMLNEQVDYSHLNACPDYRLPQILRHRGVLAYSKELADLVDGEKEIPQESDYEVEIRAGIVTAIDKLHKITGKNSIVIDHSLFSLAKDKTMLPHHKTRTIHY